MSTATPNRSPQCVLPSSLDRVKREANWRVPFAVPTSAQGNDTLTVTRWTNGAATPLHVAGHGPDGLHTIALNLTCTFVRFDHAGFRAFEGRAMPGAAQIISPGAHVEATFDAAADFLHLYVPQRLLQASFEDVFERPYHGDILISNPTFFVDAAIERLGRTLTLASDHDGLCGRMFVDAIGQAIVSRIVGLHFSSRRPSAGNVSTMPAWRLRQALDYIDVHFAEPIGLQDIASSVGLTRMHFAAQFRKSTGYRPHEFLMRRRIEQARQLLADRDLRVLDIAVQCGFRTQQHFATVFKRVLGTSPNDWRSSARTS